MLNIVTGRSGSGKTTYVNQILYNLARADNNKLLLIVPEQFSFASERSVLTNLPTKEAQNIEVLSFTRLSNYVGRSLGGTFGNCADSGTQIIIMLRTLEGLADNLTFYGSHIKSVSLAKKLIIQISEFQHERITPEMLEEASKITNISTFALKLHELSLIYKAYDALLTEEFVSVDTITDKLCSMLAENNFFEGFTIVIDAFKGFTAQELEIIKHLIKQASNVYLTLCTEDIYKSDSSMIWPAINETGKKIIRLAKKNNVAVRIIPHKESKTETGKRFENESLQFLEKNIFMDVDTKFDKQENAITLFTADTLKSECDYIAATVRKLIREDNKRLKDMAIIVRNEEAYKHELTSSLAKFGISVFEDARQPIINQPLISLCKSILTILVYGFSTDNILNYLKTGLSELNDLEISQLENYALMWGISSKSWQSDFTLNPQGMNAGKSESADAELIELNKMRQKIMSPLICLKKKVSSTKDTSLPTAFEISNAIYDFIISTNVPSTLKEFAIKLDTDGYSTLAKEQNRVYEILMETINKLATVYGNTPTSISTYYNLFCALISVTDLGSIPHGIDEITIGSADRIRLSSPEVVFIAGCEEGVFPKINSSPGILTTSDRTRLADLGINLSPSNELLACEERFIAYSALTAAKSKLFVSYHQSNGSNEAYIPSCIFTSIAELFDGNSINIISSSDLDKSYFAETKSSTFSAIAKNYKTDFNTDIVKIAGMKKALESDSFYFDKFNTLEQSRKNLPFSINDSHTATKLFGENMYLSASRVDVYYKCAFQYFCKYGIKAKKRERAELNPAVSGTIIHYVLENVIKENGKDALLKMNTEERNLAVDKWLKTYLSDSIGGFDDKTLRFKYLYNRLSFTLYSIVSRLCEEFEASDFIPCDFELSIGNGEGISSYSLDLPDGGKIEIHGSVDRVDKYEKNGTTYIRVVDYKSGGKEFVLSDILDGLNMQMLIYLFAIWDNGNERYKNVTPAGILYYPAKKASLSLSAKSTDEGTLAKELDKASRGNGLFLLNDDVLEAMEHNKQGRFIRIMGARGKLLDNLITLENMAVLKKEIDTVLEQMAVNLHNGLIPANPALGRRYENTCKSCDYITVCRNTEENGHEIVKLNNEEVYNILNGGAKNE